MKVELVDNLIWIWLLFYYILSFIMLFCLPLPYVTRSPVASTILNIFFSFDISLAHHRFKKNKKTSTANKANELILIQQTINFRLWRIGSHELLII